MENSFFLHKNRHAYMNIVGNIFSKLFWLNTKMSINNMLMWTLLNWLCVCVCWTAKFIISNELSFIKWLSYSGCWNRVRKITSQLAHLFMYKKKSVHVTKSHQPESQFVVWFIGCFRCSCSPFPWFFCKHTLARTHKYTLRSAGKTHKEHTAYLASARWLINNYW